jgi:ketosteroid isomerase-like protein
VAEANVEALQRGYEALNRGDLSVVLELLDPDFRSWIESFEGFTVEPEHVVERDDKLIAVVHQSGRGRASGVQVDARLAHVWTVAKGRATRWEAVADPEDALRGVARRSSR